MPFWKGRNISFDQRHAVLFLYSLNKSGKKENFPSINVKQDSSLMLLSNSLYLGESTFKIILEK